MNHLKAMAERIIADDDAPYRMRLIAAQILDHLDRGYIDAAIKLVNEIARNVNK